MSGMRYMENDMKGPGVESALDELDRYLTGLEDGGVNDSARVAQALAIRVRLLGVQARLERLVRARDGGSEDDTRAARGATVWERAASGEAVAGGKER